MKLSQLIKEESNVSVHDLIYDAAHECGISRIGLQHILDGQNIEADAREAVELFKVELDTEGSSQLAYRLWLAASIQLSGDELNETLEALEYLEISAIAHRPEYKQVVSALQLVKNYNSSLMSISMKSIRAHLVVLGALNAMVFDRRTDDYKQAIAEAVLKKLGIKPKDL